MDDAACISLFQSILRLKTVSGDGPITGSYSACTALLKGLCHSLLSPDSIQEIEFVKNKPILLVSLIGTNETNDALLLNAHYDVVPADLTKWTKDPWGAGVDPTTNRIYGRGTQDMKCVLAQYICALARLRAKHSSFKRTVHLTFVPDEEIGGTDGMASLLKSREYKSLGKIGLALDEGLANPNDAFTVFYGERYPMWIIITVNGPTGHGSRFVQDTAVERLMNVCNKAMKFRKEQEDEFSGKRASAGCSHCEAKKLGDVCTLNITFMDARVKMSSEDNSLLDGEERVVLNVIPTTAKAGMDIRVSPKVPMDQMKSMLDRWCAQENASWKFAPMTVPKDGQPNKLEHFVTSVNRETNPWWGVFHDAIVEQGFKLEAEVFPAGTDSRFLRQLGIPAFGFSPMRNTPIMLHEHDEFLSCETFLEGVRVYEILLERLLECDVGGGGNVSKKSKQEL